MTDAPLPDKKGDNFVVPLVLKGAGTRGTVLRVLTLIPGPSVKCGLSFLLLRDPAPRFFLGVLQFSSLQKNQHFKVQFNQGTLDEEPLCGNATATH